MRQLKILLVKDDDSVRSLYSYMLEAAGHNVKAVSNGLEALAEMDINFHDVIVTDIQTPVLNGLDLIKVVRSNNNLSDLPVVMVTPLRDSLREQARAVIDKSTEVARMREIIEAAIFRPRL
ncbi:MAG: response regulator [Chloracidobacterium sp.]|nr:response regulator [Chloracidobacterium sp.]